jgi:tetratricopeptide (TPR) repeat protein
MNQGASREAVAVWDQVLEQVPEYGEGYLHRAVSLLGSGETFILEELLDRLERALSDLDLSISLSPHPSGDNYYYRARVFEMMGFEQLYRVDQDFLLELALENLRTANVLGPRTAFSLRKEAFLLIALGRCDEGLERARELLSTANPSDVPTVAGLHSALASGYLCKGEAQTALHEMDWTLAREWSVERRWRRSIILFNLGRLDDALEELNWVLHQEPTSYGYRYHLRALIEFDLGNPEQAAQDLETGARYTWGRSGLYAYVSGLLALDQANTQVGVEALRLAEASLVRENGPILDRIRGDLQDLGVEALVLAPSVPISSTPIPTFLPTTTPRPLQGVAATPDGTITYRAEYGTGALLLAPGEYPAYRFEPVVSVQGIVQRLIIFVLPPSLYPEPNLTIQVSLWTAEGTWGMIDQVRWGENEAESPARYVLPAGDVLIAIRNWGDEMVSIGNIAVRIETLMPDGTTRHYGWPN